MQRLLAALAAELERPRELSPQVVKHIGSTYGIDRDAVGAFLENELPRLEDYEIDLILSPLFTPALPDQAVFAELLGKETVPPAQWPGLVRELAARPVRTPLLTDDGQSHLLLLREVTIERYVHRLRLDATIPEALFKLISTLPPAPDRPLLKAVARRAVWESEPRRQILTRCLLATAAGDDYRLDDALDLLKLAETYEPAGVSDLLGRIPHWRQVLQHEVRTAQSPKAFLNERIEEMHGGGRDRRGQDGARITAKERELAFLDRLERWLAG